MRVKYKFKILLALFAFFIVLVLSTAHVIAFKFDSPDSVAESFFSSLNVPYQIHKIKSSGRSIRYVETGLQSAEAPLILFIHGAPGSWEAFKEYLADYDLKQIARLVAMDRLGYGQSQRGQAEKDIKNHATAVVDILRQYQSSEVYLVGHSYGGPIAGQLAANHPELIDAALIIAPLNDPESEPVRWYAKLCNLSLLKHLLPDYINVATIEKMSHRSALEAISENWQKIQVPIIHYHGGKDNLAPCEDNLCFSQENIPSEYLHTVSHPDADHYIIWNRAHKVKELIIKLMSTVREGSPRYLNQH